MVHYVVVLEDVTYEGSFWNSLHIQKTRETFYFNPTFHTLTITIL